MPEAEDREAREVEGWEDELHEGLGSSGLTVAFVVGSVVAVPVTAGFVGLGVLGLLVRSVRDAARGVSRLVRRRPEGAAPEPVSGKIGWDRAA
ncbi:MAG TPA: hypothetical protein VKW76_08070 [Candidatus Binatia bacterium]|nr:hypothetical protein [Candidatus Binatia bacterium]